MENKKTFEVLDHENIQANSVVSFPQGRTFKIGQLLERVNFFFRQLTIPELPERFSKEGLSKLPIYATTKGFALEDWNTKGVEAEILDLESGGWKKGKVRMRVVLEFCPDELETIETNNHLENNSLDDIRKTIS
ncbi:conserved hypothetical protein [Hyella patelloides LEGE 07179]|uniref:KGK family protein n=1 Tax=Hyella patelloides LEGE 07179 TaxID=945734 RepID=A0A563VZ28_9CYAN|nr:KGK domain-containing protein [Hyella patelloides]VEP16627.1 conserved hypothetical protein [Hyella patelloides LEGE 07179]